MFALGILVTLSFVSLNAFWAMVLTYSIDNDSIFWGIVITNIAYVLLVGLVYKGVLC